MVNVSQPELSQVSTVHLGHLHYRRIELLTTPRMLYSIRRNHTILLCRWVLYMVRSGPFWVVHTLVWTKTVPFGAGRCVHY